MINCVMGVSFLILVSYKSLKKSQKIFNFYHFCKNTFKCAIKKKCFSLISLYSCVVGSLSRFKR